MEIRNAKTHEYSIDLKSQNNIKHVEAGAQGQHKLSRGYLPQKTCSAHWIKEKASSQSQKNKQTLEKEI